MRKLLVYVAALIVLQAPGARAMTGGSPVKAGSVFARSTVLIIIANSDATRLGRCSATLISADILLTDTHCFKMAEKAGVADAKYLLFFSTTVDLDRGDVRPFAQLTPADYVDDGTVDLTTIRLRGGAPAGMEPLPFLADQSLIAKVGQPVALAGYGHDPDTDPDKHLLTLNQLSTTFAPYDDDNRERSGQTNIFPVVLSSATARPQHGDSGGPGIILINGQPYLWGICQGPSNVSDVTRVTYLNVTGIVRARLREDAKKLGSDAQF